MNFNEELKKRTEEGLETCGRILGFREFLLTATEMGYGTCYMTGPTHAKAELEELIGFEKPGFELMSMIALGVAADETPAKPPRKPLEDVVTFID